MQKIPNNIFSKKISNNVKIVGYSSIEQNIKKLDMALETFEKNLNQPRYKKIIIYFFMTKKCYKIINGNK